MEGSIGCTLTTWQELCGALGGESKGWGTEAHCSFSNSNCGKVASPSWASIVFPVKWEVSPCAAGLERLEGHNAGKAAFNFEVGISRMKTILSGARRQGKQNSVSQPGRGPRHQEGEKG